MSTSQFGKPARDGAVKIEPNNDINKSWDDPPIVQKSAVTHKPYFFTSRAEHSTLRSISGVVLDPIVSGGGLFQTVIVLYPDIDDRTVLITAVGDHPISHPIPI